MSARKDKCKYEDALGQECPHLVYSDGWCIFHLPKKDKDKLKSGTDEYARCEKIEQKFTSKFKKLMQDTEENESTNKYDFRGFQLPEINLEHTTFKKKADFRYAEFINMADFSGAKFQNVALFSGAEFQNEAFFIVAEFQNEAYFIYAKFQNKAHFIGARFQKNADFCGAKFKNEADFFMALFQNEADFNLAEFKNEADFRQAEFKNDVDFRDAEFQNEADFRLATFEGKKLFQGRTRDSEGQEENLCFYGPFFFNEIDLGEKAKIIFNKVDLSQASFLDTDITNFSFRDVTWHRRPKLKPKREKALYDEFRHLYPEPGEKEKYSKEVDYSKLAENYSQLVLNYEKKRDFISAHEFRIGEMEARRKSIGSKARPEWRKLREWVNTYSLYRILSNYGTSYRHALVVLAFMLLAFAFAFLFFGFQPLSPEGVPLEAIKYKPWFDLSNAWQTLCDYGKSVLFTLSILTLQRIRFYVPLGGLSQFWLFLATIMFYSQVTLLLLAIRRRFKQ